MIHQKGIARPQPVFMHPAVFISASVLLGELFALQRNAPTVMVMQEMPAPRETHVLVRGSYDAPGEKVEAGVPEELPR